MSDLLVPRQPSNAIQCPDCRTSMRSYRCGQFLVEKCLGCQGIWFEETEMGTFKAALKELDLRGVELDAGRLVVRPSLVSLCPSCKKGLDPFRYAYDSGVEPLRCPSCAGIWLSLGQFAALVALVKKEQDLHADVQGFAREWRKDLSWVRRLRRVEFFVVAVLMLVALVVLVRAGQIRRKQSLELKKLFSTPP